MSMHKLPLTDLERSGLEKYRLPIGAPSLMADCFRLGVRHAVEAQGAPDHCDPSCTSYDLAAMVMSDCGHSTNNQMLLDRIAARIDKHVEQLLASAP